MPATSKAQYRFMRAVAGGYVKAPGLSRSQAAEYVSGQSPKNLPQRAGEKPQDRVARKMKTQKKGRSRGY